MKLHDGCCGLRTTDSAPAFRLGYQRWLDGLRGVAIVAVLGGHLSLLTGGFLGVDVFFVLSGFLITTLLAEEWGKYGSISFKRFYLRRALRLLPALFALLLICGGVALFAKSGTAAKALGQEILVTLCYLANWPALHGVFMPTLGHTWSLSLEEQFYIIWPVLLFVMLRLGLPRGGIILLVGAGILASAGLRAYLYSRHPFHDPEWQRNIWRLYLGLDTRADALLVGCLVGLLAAWNLLPKSRTFQIGAGAAAWASAIALVYMMIHSRHASHKLYLGLFTVVALMVGIILVHQLVAPSRIVSWVLESAPLVGMGRISYAVYLCHIPLIEWLAPNQVGWRYPVTSLLVAAASIAAATLSYYLVERPCLRLKHRLKAPAVLALEDAAIPAPERVQPRRLAA